MPNGGSYKENLTVNPSDEIKRSNLSCYRIDELTHYRGLPEWRQPAGAVRGEVAELMSKPFLPFHVRAKNSAFWAILIVCLGAHHSAMIFDRSEPLSTA
jgi:hypothetical protein